MAKVAIRQSGCWEWTAAVNSNPDEPYGWFRLNGKIVQAHRASHMLFKGPTGGLFVLHECDNPRCVNPGHLKLGTQKDNMADKIRRGRHRPAAARPAAQPPVPPGAPPPSPPKPPPAAEEASSEPGMPRIFSAED